MHTVGRQVESHPTGLRMQLDDDALVVLEIGDRTALDDRDAGCDCRIVAAEVRRAGQIVDLTLSVNTGATGVSDRNVASEQPQSGGRRYGVSARLHGELDEDAFDVGLHGLGGNLQLLSDALVGKSAAHRAQDAVFSRTQ
jgi:hypothetical protein